MRKMSLPFIYIDIYIIVFGRRLHKLEKLVSDPYLLYLANKNMFKLKKYIDSDLLYRGAL